jgi:hypothetical protein
MRESEAWCVLAMLWDGTAGWSTLFSAFCVRERRGAVFGLCGLIYTGLMENMMSVDTAAKMRERLRRHEPRTYHGAYYWPTTTEAGRRSRVRFCWRMAALAEQEGA